MSALAWLVSAVLAGEAQRRSIEHDVWGVLGSVVYNGKTVARFGYAGESPAWHLYEGRRLRALAEELAS